ncbi:MAG TPA: ABC transporter permease [Thermoanaerobaculia bacterium]|nr:ABC transporter permease [Thermoanaerobaculia bacterium]
MIRSLAGDLRHATRSLFRSFRRDRGLALLAVLTLAIGIGANTAIFSVVHAVLLRPLPYPEADRLVQVWNTYPLMNLPQASVAVPDYFDRREGVPAFEESALYTFESLNLSAGSADGGAPERVIGARATASLFPLLAARAAHGRVFGEDEDRPGHEQVVVLGHGLWRRAFGADPGIVGRDVRLDGVPHRVLGVMPEEFAFPTSEVEVWKPFAPTPEQRADEARGFEYCSMVARLAPGATIAQAQEQVDAIHAANAERIPEAREFWAASGFGGLVVDLREDRYGDLEPMLLLIQGVVALVLLIACFNVANLLLARLSTRHKELAVRTAMGAGPGRLARQLLGESLALALAGGALGVGVGVLGVRLVSWLGLESATRGLDVGLDGTVLAFTLGIAVATGVLFGLFPVVSVLRNDPAGTLKEEGRGQGGGRRAAAVRQGLVVVEVAMALVLLVGAGLLVRTIAALAAEDPGFATESVLLAQVDLPESRYGEPHQIAAFYDRALERVRALPGVESAAVVSAAPFSGSSSSGSYSIEGYTPAGGESAPHSIIRVVDEGYFDAMGITLLAGRKLGAEDTAEAPVVAVVDRLLVDKYFPDGEPLAGRLRRGGDDSPWIPIVGVVEPVKVYDLEREVVKETIYVHYRQMPQTGMTFVLRTAGDPEALSEPLRQAVLAVDPEQPVFNVTTMERQIRESLVTRRVSMVLLVAFAALAVALAAVGVYGVLAFSVTQRHREIGTRMALGAAPRDVLRLVVGQGLGMTGIGIALGLAGALLLGRFASALLFGVAPWDPVTLAAVTAGLLAVAALACFRPARRAATVDPMAALRQE